MNSVELMGQPFGDLHKFCSDDFGASFFKSPNYLTGQMPMDTVRLDDY